MPKIWKLTQLAPLSSSTGFVRAEIRAREARNLCDFRTMTFNNFTAFIPC